MLKKININELEKGMVLAEDFYSHDLKVLISKGKELDAHLVKYIKEKSNKAYIVIYIEDKEGPILNNNKTEIKEEKEIHIDTIVSIFKDNEMYQKALENYNKIKKGA